MLSVLFTTAMFRAAYCGCCELMDSVFEVFVDGVWMLLLKILFVVKKLDLFNVLV